MIFRALSLREPWLWAIFDAGKRVENRVWNLSYRGPVLLHASAGMLNYEFHEARQWMVRRGFARHPDIPLGTMSDVALRVAGIDPEKLPLFPEMADLQRGGIVGRARIVDVLPPSAPKTHKALTLHGALKETDAKPRAPWHVPSQYGFVLADVEKLPFVPYKGSQRLFNVPATRLPDAYRCAA